MLPPPIILLVDHVAPMRRAIRRLLGEHRFTWQEVSDEEELLQRSRQTPPVLVVIGDRTANAIPRLRAQGCVAPVVQLTNELPRSAPADGVVLIDRLQAGARLPALVAKLMAQAAV